MRLIREIVAVLSEAEGGRLLVRFRSPGGRMFSAIFD